VPVSLVAVSRHNTSSQLITCIASAHDMDTVEGLHEPHHWALTFSPSMCMHSQRYLSE
jgi:hypothetical protein